MVDSPSDTDNNPKLSLHNGCEELISQNLIDYIKMPENIKRRVRALKNVQYKTLELDEEFYKKLYQLEKEFEYKHQALFDERRLIVEGKKEPTDEESSFEEHFEELAESISKEVSEKLKIGDVPAENVKGIPHFWFKVLNHVPLIQSMIMEEDEPILKNLVDIKCEMSPETMPGFTLEFFFTPNEYFANEKLTKQYFFSYEIPKDDPFEYSGPEIVASQGCIIDWNKGKDVTIKQVKKVQKHKGRGEKRVILKTVKADSFFNFFHPEKSSIENSDDDSYDLLDMDFKIGQFMRESLIPQAVLFYTGEADDELEEDDEMEDDSEDEDSDELASDDEDIETDEKHHRKNKAKPRKKSSNNNNEECKQQ